MQNVERVPRGLQAGLARAWGSSSVVVLEGARATGKTTLARNTVDSSRFVSFVESPDQLHRAIADLRGFLESLPFGCVLDEAQLVPNLQVEIKRVVDQTGRPGQFLLTGSARLSRNELGGTDPLAGRVRRLRVHGFTQNELAGSPSDVISALFDSDPREWTLEPIDQAAVVARFATGGMPTLRTVADFAERTQRTIDYVDDLFSGDVYETGRNRSGISRLFRYLAATSGSIENFSKYQNGTQLSKDAVIGYLDALRAVHLVDDLPAYSRVPGTRETDRPRSFVLDPAFVVAQVGGETATALLDVERAGPFLETSVAQELERLLGWSTTNAKLHHWRRNDKDEVDLLLERQDGMVIAIEVKSKRSITNRDGSGIAAFAAQYPDRFLRGFVIHPGDALLPIIPPNVWALPLSALWTIGEPVRLSVEPPLSLQQRIDRAVATVSSTHRLIPVAEVMRRQAELRKSQQPTVDRMNAIVFALQKLEVPSQITARPPWPTGWGRPQAEPTDVLLAGETTMQIWSVNNAVADATLAVRLVGETAHWNLSGTGLLNELSAEFSGPWDADQTAGLDQLFGTFADALPELVLAFRESKTKESKP
jgi:uncharacterized protein